jgi:hypothetical protein
MRRTGWLIFLVVALACFAAAQSSPHYAPFFATKAVYVYQGGSANSPDGKNTVSVRLLDENADDFPSEVLIRTPSGTLHATIHFGLNAQVLWSGNSKAFAITGSSEGGNGRYQTDIFYIEANRLRRAPLTPVLERAFGHPVRCGWSELPNVVAVKWLEGSSALLVATQIIAHSNCDSFGTFAGFVVGDDGLRVVKRFNQLEVKRLYGSDLGPELRDANDDCIRNPSSCFVSTNHPELTSKAQSSR